MTSSIARAPTSRERENNKRRERRRRAIAARIFSGLRQFGNYKLPKHCDNNEVLKALCREAGWTVEEDGTTYKAGSRPAYAYAVDLMTSAQRDDTVFEGDHKVTEHASGTCTPIGNSPSPNSPDHGDFSLPMNSTISYGGDGMTPLLPWLKGLKKSSTVSALQVMRGGSFSAPVTPPLSSPRVDARQGKVDLGADFNLIKADGTMEMAFSKSKCDGISSTATTMPFPKDGYPDGVVYKGPWPQKPCLASGTSTPTYPPSILVSGTCTPSYVLPSGTSTPGHSSLLPSGASTPTCSSSLTSMRALPMQFAAAISNLALICEDASQSPADDQEHPINTAHITSKPSLRKDATNMQGRFAPNNMFMVPVVGSNSSSPPAKNGGSFCSDLSSIPWSVESSEALSTLGQVKNCAEAVPDARSIGIDDFKFNMSNAPQNRSMITVVKPWEGETIHEVSLGEEDLELTLGSSTSKKSIKC